MKESQEQIDMMLGFSGDDLVFDVGVLKGIPITDMKPIEDFGSPYGVNKLLLSFQVSSYNFYSLGVEIRDTFEYALNNKLYTFQLNSFSDDYTGWMELKATQIGLDDV
jgi:hypothetical protein